MTVRRILTLIRDHLRTIEASKPLDVACIRGFTLGIINRITALDEPSVERERLPFGWFNARTHGNNLGDLGSERMARRVSLGVMPFTE